MNDNQPAASASKVVILDPTKWTSRDVNEFANSLAVLLISEDNPTEIVRFGKPMFVVWLTEDGYLRVKAAPTKNGLPTPAIFEVGQVTQSDTGYFADVYPIYGEGLGSQSLHSDGLSAVREVCRYFWMRVKMSMQQQEKELS